MMKLNFKLNPILKDKVEKKLKKNSKKIVGLIS